MLNDVVANAIAAIIIGISNLENADKYKLLVSNFIEDTPNGNFVARMSRLPHEASFDKSNGTLLMLAFTNTPKHCVLNSICFSTKEVLQYDSLPDCINEARRTSFFKTLVTALNLHFGLNKQRWTFTLCPCPKQVGNECAIMALGFLKVLVTLGAELTNVDPNNCKVYREEYVGQLLSSTEDGRAFYMKCNNDPVLVLRSLEIRQKERNKLGYLDRMIEKLACLKAKSIRAKNENLRKEIINLTIAINSKLREYTENFVIQK